jgi:hypothetical protein
MILLSIAKEKLALVIATLILEIAIALSSEGNRDTSSHRERRSLVFPNGTILQVRSDTSLSRSYALHKEYRITLLLHYYFIPLPNVNAL